MSRLFTLNLYDSILKWLLWSVILIFLIPNQTLVKMELIPHDIFEYNAKLQNDADALLNLFDGMDSVPIFLKDEPIIKTGTNTERGVAYTTCDGNEFPKIFVKKIFYQKTNRIQLNNILKHELTHSWLCRQQLMSGHDARFRQKFEQIGGFGN
ncbi:hypothetical protein BH10ACI1_BH10ACI1_21090 [soil metagenome]